jgi:hypothetical protein
MNNKSILFFIRKGLFFLVGFLIIVYIIDIGIKFTVKQIEVGEYGILNKINDGKINAEILISGSSRALKAINPQVITKETGLSCYNIASDGSDLGVQLPKLKWYLNHNKKPRILIQDVSQFGGEISNTIYEPFKYIPYISNDSLYYGLLKIDKDFWIHKYIFASNLLYYNFDFYARLIQDLIQNIDKKDKFINGFLPDNSKWAGNFELYKKQNPKGINCFISEEYSSYLKEMVNFCKNKKIVLVLVVLPNYFRLQEVTKNTDYVFNFYSQLEQVPFIYYLNYVSNDIASDDKNFYNFTHLNFDGANKFSKILAVDLFQITR